MPKDSKKRVPHPIRPAHPQRNVGGVLGLLLGQTKDTRGVLKAHESFDVMLPGGAKKPVTLSNTVVRYQRKSQSEYRYAVLAETPSQEGSSAFIYSVLGTLFFAPDPSLQFKLKRNNKKHHKDGRRVVKLYKEDFHVFAERGDVPQHEANVLSHFPALRAKPLTVDVQETALVMGYVPGIDLFDLLKESCLSPTQAIDLILLLLEQLKVAHAKKIIHRDLKPENIRVVRDKDGNPIAVYILDWGLSKSSPTEQDREHAKIHNSASEGVGSVATVSPEAVFRGTVTDEASDLFGMGRIIQMLFGSADQPEEPGDILDYFQVSDIEGMFENYALEDLSERHREDIKQLVLEMVSLCSETRPSMDAVITFFSNVKQEMAAYHENIKNNQLR